MTSDFKTPLVVSPDRYLTNTAGEYTWTPDRASEAWSSAYRAWQEALETVNRLPRGVLLIGMPGSGKSTFVSSRKPVFWELALAETDVIFDATLTSRIARRPLLELAKGAGARIEAIVFDVPLYVAMQRNSERPFNRRVPHPTMARMWQELETEPPTLVEGFWRITSMNQ